MEYILEHDRFNFSYQESKKIFKKFKSLTDDEFILNIKEVLHFACFICFIKEIPTEQCLADGGLIHELIHLNSEIETVNPLGAIRHMFNKQLLLK